MVDFSLPDQPGILPQQWIEKAVAAGVIKSNWTIHPSTIQPASLDLRLGEIAHRLRCSFLPNGRVVDERLESLRLGDPIDLNRGAVLEKNRPYLIPLAERLDLPEGLQARTNPKSSTGRVDVFTRVVCDRGYHFDEIPAGYTGPLYLEVVSRSFTIRVERLLSLNQLRLLTGPSVVDDTLMRELHLAQPLLYDRAGEPIPVSALHTRGGLFLSLDLPLGDSPIGWRARKNSLLLDLSKVDHYRPSAFWEPVYADVRDGGVVLEPDEFYLLMSSEAVSIPPSFAAEMTAYDPTSGELRTHYAGFFDPGFGFGAVRGTRAALEVRAHDVPFLVEPGQLVCRLGFERLVEEPNQLYGRGIGSTYQGQTAALSKHFRYPRPEETAQLRLLTQ